MTQSNQAIDHLNPGHLDHGTLNAFIDGELSAREQQEIQRHLAVCHACTLRVLYATQLKAATARTGHRFPLSPEVLARLTTQLHSRTQSQSHFQLKQGRPSASIPFDLSAP